MSIRFLKSPMTLQSPSLLSMEDDPRGQITRYRKFEVWTTRYGISSQIAGLTRRQNVPLLLESLNPFKLGPRRTLDCTLCYVTTYSPQTMVPYSSDPSDSIRRKSLIAHPVGDALPLNVGFAPNMVRNRIVHLVVHREFDDTIPKREPEMLSS